MSSNHQPFTSPNSRAPLYPSTAGPGVLNPGTQLNCDLAQGEPFCPSNSTPPVPIVTAFGLEPLCECLGKGASDFDRAISENPERLIRSVHTQKFTEAPQKWIDVLFQFGERAFLYGSPSRIAGYASSPTEAERIVREFTDSFGIKKTPVGGSFQLIRKERYDEITCENVDIGPETVLSDEAFALHYTSSARSTALRPTSIPHSYGRDDLRPIGFSNVSSRRKPAAWRPL